MQVHLLQFLFIVFIGALIVVVGLIVKNHIKRRKLEAKKRHRHLPFCSDELDLIVSYMEKSDIGNLSLVCKEAKQAAYSSTIWNGLCGRVSMERIGGLLNSERYDGKIKTIELIIDQDDDNSFEDEFIDGQLFERMNQKFRIEQITIHASTLALFKFNLLAHLERLESVTCLKLLDNSKECISYNNSLMPIKLPKKLEYLKIKGFNRVLNRCSVFESLFTQSEGIKIVKLENNQGYNEMKFNITDSTLDQMTCFSLSGTTNISVESLNRLLGNCPNLKQLNLSSSTFSKPLSINVPNTVERVDLSYCLLDTFTLTGIACLPHLKFINLLSTLVPLDILVLYCKVGRSIICQIASKEEIQILKQLKHVRFVRLSPVNIVSKIKEIQHSTSYTSSDPTNKLLHCTLFYQQIFNDPIEAPKITLRPTKPYKMKLIQYKE